MGVTYKLTDEIVQFIIEQKQTTPQLSCRELVELIHGQFNLPVSKSSVHDVLKEHNISSPRGRKAKNKFEIPAEKKAQLLANLPVIVPAKSKDETQQPADKAPAKPAFKLPKEILKPLQAGEAEALSEVLLKAAFYDYFPSSQASLTYEEYKSNNSNNLRKEIEYRSLMVNAVRVTVEDQPPVYIDARYKTLANQLSGMIHQAPIERALTDMTNKLISGIETIVINKFTPNSHEILPPGLGACAGSRAAKSSADIALLNDKGDALAEFTGISVQTIKFIIGIDSKDIENKILTSVDQNRVEEARSYTRHAPQRFIEIEHPWPQGGMRTILLLTIENTIDRIIISNCPGAAPAASLVRQYIELGSAVPDLDGAAPPLAAETLGLEGILKEHAQDYLLGKRFLESEWEQVTRTIMDKRANDQICVFEPSHPGAADHLLSVLKRFNALALKDGYGRLIHFRLTSE